MDVLDYLNPDIWPAVIDTINETGYGRWVGHEFFAKGDKMAALEAAFKLFDR